MTPSHSLRLWGRTHIALFTVTCTILNSIRGNVIIIFSIVEDSYTMIFFFKHFWNTVAMFINVSLEKQYGYININEKNIFCKYIYFIVVSALRGEHCVSQRHATICCLLLKRKIVNTYLLVSLYVKIHNMFFYV